MDQTEARVVAVREIGPDDIAIDIETPDGFEARPGQFVKLTGDGESRFYTISSPDVDGSFEVTVEVDPEGTLGPWLAAREPDDTVGIITDADIAPAYIGSDEIAHAAAWNPMLLQMEQEVEGSTMLFDSAQIPEEIVDAARRVAQEVARGELAPEAVDEQAFARRLYLQSEPDMIIRTGGDQRTSNFLPWQSTYTEWFFVDQLWPEFTRERYEQCLEDFDLRERRFGK